MMRDARTLSSKTDQMEMRESASSANSLDIWLEIALRKVMMEEEILEEMMIEEETIMIEMIEETEMEDLLEIEMTEMVEILEVVIEEILEVMIEVEIEEVIEVRKNASIVKDLVTWQESVLRRENQEIIMEIEEMGTDMSREILEMIENVTNVKVLVIWQEIVQNKVTVLAEKEKFRKIEMTIEEDIETETNTEDLEMSNHKHVHNGRKMNQ